MAQEETSPSFSNICPEKRRQCKFIPEWTLKKDFSPWLIPVEEDPHKAFCLYCKKVFPVSHGGLHDVKAHAKGKRHLLLAQQYFHDNFSSLPFQVPRINYDWNHLKVTYPFETLLLSNQKFKPFLCSSQVASSTMLKTSSIQNGILRTTCGSLHLLFCDPLFYFIVYF